MDNQKIANLLNLALDATSREREESMELDVGYDEQTQRWDIIVRYVGDIGSLETPDILVTKLLGNYAVINLPQDEIENIAQNPLVEYVEKPRRIFFSAFTGRAVSCVNAVQNQGLRLMGEGVLIACIDSGIDYAHQDFLNEDGTTRILRLWDQTISGDPPNGYRIGTEYTQEEINQALQAPTPREREEIVPSRDSSGHGTAVMGIAAGNGNESGGVYRGMAPDSQLLVVKLGLPRPNSFPRTTELMQGVDYAVKQAIALGLPLVINLSFGNSYGSHSGRSLVETYLNDAANFGQTVICVGTGNEGNRGGHTSGTVREGERLSIEMGIGEYEPTVNVQIWKNYQDELGIIIEHPSGVQAGPIRQNQEAQRIRLVDTELLIYYGEPSPYSVAQEIYVDFLPVGSYIDSGVWKFHFVPVRIVQGDFDMWLPGGNVLGSATRFYQPTPDTTLTIPSTAFQVIAVGAYNPVLQSYADFSGRGYTRLLRQIKPDLVAPGVDIRTVRAGGGYAEVTGTSFAAPFVSGAAALLMEWGIVRGNDAYLYGADIIGLS
ncbi:MAG: peptidase S8 [Clostridia bacterium]|nr:peptidase S8 [Clostridia bacterium]